MAPRDPVTPAQPSLLTTGEAARRLGIGTATLKRWAESGRVPSLRTAGRHRRFDEADVERLRERLSSAPDALARWTDRLLADRDQALTAALLLERERLGAWCVVADALGPVIAELGRRWEEGNVCVLAEHDASHRLTRALARCAEGLALSSDGPRIVLATAEGEDHTLGLSLAELAVRERGWRAIWAGRATPAAEIVRAVEAGEVEAVALSASVAADPASLAREIELLGPVCSARKIPLVAGGAGRWREDRADLYVERRFAGLDAWMQRIETARVGPHALSRVARDGADGAARPPPATATRPDTRARLR
ncbi:MAG: excisionase family DNA-binding protein [Anaeromyxobacteraceae bacterium]